MNKVTVPRAIDRTGVAKQKWRRIIRLSLFSALFVLPIGGHPSAGPLPSDWPQWRGPSRDGLVEGEGWPGSLADLKRTWRVDLGKGYPGPVVAGDRVFLVSSGASEEVVVQALGRDDGAEIWRASWSSSGSVPFFARQNGDWVRSTPAWDGEALYVGDMREQLVALDGVTGKERWRFDFPAKYGTDVPDFGFASSPLVVGDHVYVQAANSVVKLSRKTGAPVWRALESDGSMARSGAFSSPVVARIDGTEQLIVLTRDGLNGLALDSSALLWNRPVANYRGMHILTPVVWRGKLFTSPYRERSYLFSIEHREDGRYVTEPVWTNKATAYMSTPVVIDGHAYLHLANRRLECIDLATGESRWRSTSRFGRYWSMVSQGDKILALDEDGTLYLLRANPEKFEQLDAVTVSEHETWGHLAVSNNQLFVRELEAIASHTWRDAAPAGSATTAPTEPVSEDSLRVESDK